MIDTKTDENQIGGIARKQRLTRAARIICKRP